MTHNMRMNTLNTKMIGGTPEVRSDLYWQLTFEIFHFAFDIWHSIFDIWHIWYSAIPNNRNSAPGVGEEPVRLFTQVDVHHVERHLLCFNIVAIDFIIVNIIVIIAWILTHRPFSQGDISCGKWILLIDFHYDNFHHCDLDHLDHSHQQPQHDQSLFLIFRKIPFSPARQGGCALQMDKTWQSIKPWLFSVECIFYNFNFNFTSYCRQWWHQGQLLAREPHQPGERCSKQVPSAMFAFYQCFCCYRLVNEWLGHA